MPNLKDLRIRIASVRSTQKITSAMKMMAATKLRQAQSAAEAGRPFADRLERVLAGLAASLPTLDGAPKLLAGSGRDDAHLMVVVTADRGLCGGFNSSVVREARRQIAAHRAAGKKVMLVCVGRKGRDQLRRQYGELIIDTLENITRQGADYADAQALGSRLSDMFDAGEFDTASVIYNRFKSAISQVVTVRQIVPFAPPPPEEGGEETKAEDNGPKAMYIMEPSEEEILADLLPRNLSVQIFRALLESYASEQGARMTAMDNATRNAGEMIDRLNLTYNRTRQANITRELIEIISGAEAL